jgi:hypothetical protein
MGKSDTVAFLVGSGKSAQSTFPLPDKPEEYQLFAW